MNNLGAWAIKKNIFEAVAKKTYSQDEIAKAQSMYYDNSNSQKEYRNIDGVAVIPIHGIIERYDNIFTWLMGGTSIECITKSFDQAMADDTVEAILFDINSPGGSIDGPPELAETIALSRGKKPIISYVSRVGASAAYWIAAASDQIVLHPSAEVGSIGVLVNVTIEKENDLYEEICIVSSLSPNKAPDLTTDDGRFQIQSYIDKLAAMFIDSIARYRNVEPAAVIAEFGRGDVVLGADAYGRRMVDFLGNFKDALSIAKNEKERIMSQTTNTAQSLTLDTKAGMIDEDKITKEWLKKNKPELLDEVEKESEEEGAAAERERIASIDAIPVPEGMASHVADILAAAKKTATATAGSVAILMMQKQKEVSACRHIDLAVEPLQYLLQISQL